MNQVSRLIHYLFDLQKQGLGRTPFFLRIVFLTFFVLITPIAILMIATVESYFLLIIVGLPLCLSVLLAPIYLLFNTIRRLRDVFVGYDMAVVAIFYIPTLLLITYLLIKYFPYIFVIFLLPFAFGPNQGIVEFMFGLLGILFSNVIIGTLLPSNLMVKKKAD